MSFLICSITIGQQRCLKIYNLILNSLETLQVYQNWEILKKTQKESSWENLSYEFEKIDFNIFFTDLEMLQ